MLISSSRRIGRELLEANSIYSRYLTIISLNHLILIVTAIITLSFNSELSSPWTFPGSSIKQ